MPNMLCIAALCSGLMVIAPDMDTEKAPMDLKAEMPQVSLPGKWLSSFDEARKLAASNNVPLVLHFEAPWCGACRTMDAAVLNQPDVIQQLATAAVGVRIDADVSPELISRYGIASLPTEVIISPDGTEVGRFVGGTTLESYVSRLKSLHDPIARSAGTGPTTTVTGGSTSELDEKLRECLIVQHDGKMVGLGGFSPVALLKEKQWQRGTAEFVATHEGVDYFFQSAAEQTEFQSAPGDFVPKLHGCDLVQLFRENRAQVGAIEFGAFYKGRMFFFASMENRQQFQRNPAWYADGISTGSVENTEDFPFLKASIVK